MLKCWGEKYTISKVVLYWSFFCFFFTPLPLFSLHFSDYKNQTERLKKALWRVHFYYISCVTGFDKKRISLMIISFVFIAFCSLWSINFPIRGSNVFSQIFVPELRPPSLLFFYFWCFFYFSKLCFCFNVLSSHGIQSNHLIWTEGYILI